MPKLRPSKHIIITIMMPRMVKEKEGGREREGGRKREREKVRESFLKLKHSK